MLELYVAGTPVKTLTQRFGIPRQTIFRHARRAGVVRQPRSFSDAEVAEVVAMYESGLGLDRIGARVGASPMRVRRLLTGAGVQIRAQQGGRPSGARPGRAARPVRPAEHSGSRRVGERRQDLMRTVFARTIGVCPRPSRAATPASTCA